MTVKIISNVRRHDAPERMMSPQLQENGWLRCEAVLTKTGVFKYRNADGTERRELRLPQHVFDAESLKSFHLVPVTDDHPAPGWLDSQNAKEFSCGSVDMPVKDGDKVRAKLLVTDAALVAKLMNGDKAQVSNGYFADLEVRSGEYEGETFDAVQTNIRGNHVAIVDEARAGPEARVKLDGADAVMVRVVQGATPEPNEEPPMLKFKIDGVEFEAPDQTIQAVDKRMKKLDEKIADRDAQIAQLTAECGKQTGRADAVEKDLAKAKDSLAKATDQKTIDAYVASRVELVEKARSFLGEDFKADGKNATDIRRAVVEKLSPDLKLDGKDAGYVAAAFDALVASNKADGALERARRAMGGNDDGVERERPTVNEKDAPFRKFVEDSQNAWKQPLPATRKRNAERGIK